MPTTTFTGRRPAYIERYARAVAAVNRYEDIQRTIQDERAAVQYLDSLIAQERQTLAGLQDVFRTPPADFTAAQSLLRQQYQLEDARRQADAASRAAAAAGARVAPETLQAVLEPFRRGDAASGVAQARNALRGATRAQADKILSQLEAVAGTYSIAAADLTELRAFADRNARPTPTGGRPGAATQEAEQAFAEALEGAYFAGPSGIRGGYDGLEVVNLRGLTADALRERAQLGDEAQAKRLAARAEALDKSAFATAEDALQAALAVVRATGDPSSIEDEYARTIYEEARQTQAYRNDQRADFEQEVLDSRKRLAELESRRQAAPGSQYADPRQEAIRRELRARGYDLDRNDGRYLRYQKTPYYDLLIDADDKLSSVLADDVGLSPVNRGQRLAETLVLQYDRTGREYNIETLRDQLSKALSGEDLQDALAYALAFKEYQTLGLEEPSQRELQRRKEADEARQREEQRREAEAALRETEEARRDVNQVEAIAREVAPTVRGLRTPEDPGASARALYTRLRARGLSPDEARAEALRELEAAREPMLLPSVDQAPAPAPEPEPARITDPTNASYSYEARPEGGYRVFLRGREVSPAAAGTRAARSIESVLSGGAPLPAPAPAPDQAPEPEPPSAADLLAGQTVAGYEPPRFGQTPDVSEPEPEPFDVQSLSDEELDRRLQEARRRLEGLQ